MLDTLDIRYLHQINLNASDQDQGLSWLIGYQNYNFIIKRYPGPAPDKGWTSHRVGTVVVGVVCTLWPSNMVTLYPCASTITQHLNTAPTEESSTHILIVLTVHDQGKSSSRMACAKCCLKVVTRPRSALSPARVKEFSAWSSLCSSWVVR